MWPEGKRVHMIGIGGAGMSSLARYFRDAGARVTGSDAHASPLLERLARDGFGVTHTQDGRNVEDGVDFAVRTAAAAPENPEVRACGRKGIELLKYSEALGRAMNGHAGIAVAGTHGKTTVSAMTAFLMRECGLDPSFVIGGAASCLGGVGGARGAGEHLVAEACEYDRSFLNLAPGLIVITNIEEDHLDYYRDLDDLRGAFADLVRLGKEGGAVIAWDGIPDLAQVTGTERIEVLTFGFGESADLRVVGLDAGRSGTDFDLLFRGDALGSFRVSQTGRHSVLNAAAAVMAALRAGSRIESIRSALPRFEGLSRRMELRGLYGTVLLYSDYAHHPSEIDAVYDAMRTAHPASRLVTAYQAHQRSRTAHFFDGLARSLSGFDRALLLDSFSVRESGVEDLPDGRDLAEAITRRGGSAFYVGSLEEAPDRISAHVEKDDVLILMGAGDIDEVARSLGEKLRTL